MNLNYVYMKWRCTVVTMLSILSMERELTKLVTSWNCSAEPFSSQPKKRQGRMDSKLWKQVKSSKIPVKDEGRGKRSEGEVLPHASCMIMKWLTQREIVPANP